MGGIYQTIRNLSLDVVTGAMVGTLFVAGYLRVGVPITTVLLLGLTVWVLYTVDHLIDAKRTKHDATSSRHIFHQHYFKQLLVALIVVVAACAYLALGLSLRTLTFGATLLGLAIVYFLIIKYLPLARGYAKEILSALLYAAGVFLAPYTLLAGGVSMQLVTFFCQFAMVAFLNMLIFSSYELSADKADGCSSLAMNLGPVWTQRIVLMAMALVFVSGMHSALVFQYDRPYLAVQAILFFMVTTLSLIYFKPSVFAAQERYRIFGDLIFFYPLALAV